MVINEVLWIITNFPLLLVEILIYKRLFLSEISQPRSNEQ